MSTTDVADANGNQSESGPRPPRVADLGAFRGRTTRPGAPVMPPGWRPDADRTVRSSPAAARPPSAVDRPPPVGAVRPPTTAPVADAPRARVLASRATGTDIRIVRRIRPWSVWKLSLAFALCMVAVVATAGAILWALAASLGVLGKVEGFVEDLGFDDFTLDGAAMLRAIALGGLVVAVATSMMATVLAALFNLLSDLTGGLEAELAPKRPRRPRRRRGVRRGRAGRRERETPDVAVTAPHRVADVVGNGDAPVPAAGVEVHGRSTRPILDLTDQVDPADAGNGVGGGGDRIQQALDEIILSDPPESGTNGTNGTNGTEPDGPRVDPGP